MVLGELVQLMLPVQIGAAVARVYDAELRTKLECHRDGRAHPAQFRMRRGGLGDLGVGLGERRLELGENLLGLAAVSAEEPLERIESEVLDSGDRKSASPFARKMPAHPIGD